MKTNTIRVINLLLCLKLVFYSLTLHAFEVNAGEDHYTIYNIPQVLGVLPHEGVAASGGAINVEGCDDYTYEWFESNHPTPFSILKNPIVSPYETTSYKLVVTDCNGLACEATTTIYIADPEIIKLGHESNVAAQQLEKYFFQVYIPTTHGGKLNVETTSGMITEFYKPANNSSNYLDFINNTDVGEGYYGWYKFAIEGAVGNYTITTEFTQEREVQKRPWNFYWWPLKGDYISAGPNNIAESIVTTNTSISDDVQVVAPSDTAGLVQLTINGVNNTYGHADIITSGFDGQLQTSKNNHIVSGDDEVYTFINAYDTVGSYQPLKKYDEIFQTTTLQTEMQNIGNQIKYDWMADGYTDIYGNPINWPLFSWEGYCLGATKASIFKNQPIPESEFNMNTDELECLWAMLGNGADSSPLATNATDNPSAPSNLLLPSTDVPTINTNEPCDRFSGRTHWVLEKYIRSNYTYALYSNLRCECNSTDPDDIAGFNPGEVWNHGVWRYTASYKEADGINNPNVLEINMKIWANQDITLSEEENTENDLTAINPNDPSINRIIDYIYVVEYNTIGNTKIDSAYDNWISIGGEGRYLPVLVSYSVPEEWEAKRTVKGVPFFNQDLTKDYVEILDANN